MSILIQYQDGKCISDGIIYQRKTPSPAYCCEKSQTFCIGEVFDSSFEEVAQSGWEKNPDILNTYEGAFAIAKVDEDGCRFAVDINGIETFFYYDKRGCFILSDNFWDIVRIIKPEFGDLNFSRIKQYLLCASVTGETVIDGLKILLPSHAGVYDSKQQTLSIQKYRQFRYTGEVSQVDKAVQNMDKIMHRTMASIKRKCGNVCYGVGISGGLDSRIIPHYAKKHGMNVTSFNICVEKPHRLWLARSCKNARKLSKIFNIPYQNVEWNPKSIEGKMKLKVRNYPLGAGGNTFKYEDSGLPEFDVLLTGGSGMIVGSELPADIHALSKSQLYEAMKQEFVLSIGASKFESRVSRALSYLFGIKAKVRTGKKQFIKYVVGEDELRKAEKMLADFIDEGIREGKTNLDIYEDYFLNVVGFGNRYGAFESLFGTKRSFSIYVPFLLKETLSWTPELLENRAVLNELIRQKVPEAANVKSESFYVAPSEKAPNKLRRIRVMFEYLLRGNGTAIGEYYFKKVQIKHAFSLCMHNDCTWFFEIFDVKDKIDELSKRNSYSRDCINLWELKNFIDCIEKKEYLYFVYDE